jgi:hypothetical protein
VLGSYLAILLGCLVRDRPAHQAITQKLLPDQNWSSVITLLDEFMGFNQQVCPEQLDSSCPDSPDEGQKPLALHVLEIVNMLKEL